MEAATGAKPYISKIDVLDHGHVILEKYMGNEIDILSNARVSFNDDVEGETAADLSERDKGVINFLMREHHGTPFEAPVFRFDIKAPLFVFREWHRHRIGWSYNEWSARYSRINPEFYVPAPENIRTQVGKPGSYTFEPIDDPVLLSDVTHMLESHGRDCFRKYDNLLEKGVAKEVARTVLPVSMYSRMKATCNLRSLLNFITLRSDPNAQWEIRQFSIAMERMLEQELPLVMELFNEHGLVAP